MRYAPDLPEHCDHYPGVLCGDPREMACPAPCARGHCGDRLYAGVHPADLDSGFAVSPVKASPAEILLFLHGPDRPAGHPALLPALHRRGPAVPADDAALPALPAPAGAEAGPVF